jgi:hypothetical protein
MTGNDWQVRGLSKLGQSAGRASGRSGRRKGYTETEQNMGSEQDSREGNNVGKQRK